MSDRRPDGGEAEVGGKGGPPGGDVVELPLVEPVDNETDKGGKARAGEREGGRVARGGGVSAATATAAAAGGGVGLGLEGGENSGEQAVHVREEVGRELRGRERGEAMEGRAGGGRQKQGLTFHGGEKTINTQSLRRRRRSSSSTSLRVGVGGGDGALHQAGEPRGAGLLV